VLKSDTDVESNTMSAIEIFDDTSLKIAWAHDHTTQRPELPCDYRFKQFHYVYKGTLMLFIVTTSIGQMIGCGLDESSSIPDEVRGFVFVIALKNSACCRPGKEDKAAAA
jgi:hypothetical protein